MYDNIYYCINAENTCPKKDSCLRYLNEKDKMAATLFKAACTEENNYVLYIHKDIEQENMKEGETDKRGEEQTS